MAVFVWATGAVPVTVSAVTGTITFTVNNRTTTTQIGVAALWNNTLGSPKTFAGAVIPVVLGPNTANVFTLTNTSALTLTSAEVEIRLPDPHMDAFIQTQPGILFTYLPGSFFRDSDPTGSP
jgi:hypothetical protein